MLKKRILGFIMSLSVLAGLFVTVNAQEVNGILFSQTAHIQIFGESDLDSADVITLTVYDENNKMIFVDQKMTTGVYNFKISIDDVSKSYTYNINQGGNLINDTVKSVSASNILSYGMKLYNMKNTELDVFFENPWGLTDEDIDDYTPIITYYDKQGKLIDCVIFETGSFDFTKDHITFEAFPPEDAAEVKAFLWNNTVQMKPHVEAEEDGDREVTVFFGDSNTATNFYAAHIENYYLTRYPDRKMMFVNCGINGTTATQGIDRLEWDVLSEDPDRVIISYGTNDIGYSMYSKDSTATDDEKQEKIDLCIESVESLIKTLQQKNIEVVLLTPFVIDGGDYGTYSASDLMPGASEALKKVGDGYKELGEKYDVKVIDTWQITNDVTSESRNQNGSDMYLFYPDRIHMNPEGAQAVMYQYVKDMGLNDIVAYVEINAETGTVKTENADVKLNSYTDSEIEYAYYAKSLPLGVDSNYTAAEKKFKGMDLTEINQEIIKVTGLEEGTYSVCYDGKSIVECTANELANGINIAENEKNPAQIKAKKIIEYLWAGKMEEIKGNGSKQPLYAKGLLNDYDAIYNLPDSEEKDKYVEYITMEKEIMRNLLNADYIAETEEYTVTIIKK